MTNNLSFSINRLLQNKDKQTLTRIMNELSAFEIADLIAEKSLEDKILVFSVLESKLADETLDYLSVENQKEILKALPKIQVANMLIMMAPDDRTALFEELPRPTIDEYIKLLPINERAVAIKLLGYPEDTVGRLMTTDYIAVRLDWTVEQVLDHIRKYGHDSETLTYIYVVDDNHVLIDDIKLREFLFVPKDYTVAQLGDRTFIALNPYEKAQEVINTFEKYGRNALPVINEKGIIIGIVTIDDILSLASQITTEEMQKVSGVEALDEPYMEAPFLELMKKRARWLVVIFIGEMFTATAMSYYEVAISKAVVLALFLPLIISSGGNAGSQSSTLIIRALALGEVKIRDWYRVMRREILSGAFLGLILGTIGFIRVVLWSSFSTIYGEHWILIAFTIFFALLGVVLWGTICGAILPLFLRSIKIDPATASAPLVATIVDVVGIIIYFTIAIILLQGHLL